MYVYLYTHGLCHSKILQTVENHQPGWLGGVHRCLGRLHSLVLVRGGGDSFRGIVVGQRWKIIYHGFMWFAMV